MIDFTLNQFITLLNTLKEKNFLFKTFSDYLGNPENNSIILRHDVDRLPLNSLRTAQIENDLGIKGTYYFRVVPESFDVGIISKIASLEHEIGYHYETMDTCNGDIDKAYEEFSYNLKKLREIVQISTICMHGSPLSSYDNRDIWKKYQYADLGIHGEPYLDLDFNKIAYYTDTGRRWNGGKFAIRDKTKKFFNGSFEQPIFKSTDQIIKSIEKGLFPTQVMLTFHPQRWTDSSIPWIKEFVWQNMKNVGKYFLVKIR